MENDNVIFGEELITEIAQWSRDEVSVYSEDINIFNEFKEDKRCLRATPYYSYRDESFLAGDCYFARAYKGSLAKQLERMGIKK